jgi:hypothetical protein
MRPSDAVAPRKGMRSNRGRVDSLNDLDAGHDIQF